MKVVLDANIFISAFFWGGNPRLVLERAIKKADELFVSKEILDEVETVLGRPKFHVDKNKIEYLLKSIEEISTKTINSKRIVSGSRDIKDNKYLECAAAANADYIVSGDRHLLELSEYNGIKIVTAKEYLEA